MNCQDAYKSFNEGRGVGIDVLGIIFIFGTIATHSYIAGSLSAGFYRASKALLAKTEDHSKKNLINIVGNHKSVVQRLSGDTEIETPVEELNLGDVIVKETGFLKLSIIYAPLDIYAMIKSG